MNSRNAFADFIENELNMDVLVEIEAERMRRRKEALDELLRCLQELKDLLSGFSPYGRIPPKDNRD